MRAQSADRSDRRGDRRPFLLSVVCRRGSALVDPWAALDGLRALLEPVSSQGRRPQRQLTPPVAVREPRARGTSPGSGTAPMAASRRAEIDPIADSVGCPYSLGMSSDQFFYKTLTGETACGDTGYFLKLSAGRDGDTLYLRHATRELTQGDDPHSMLLCFCSGGSRPVTVEERNRIGADGCPNVVLWAVLWSESSNAQEIEGLGNTRGLIEKFFNYYKSSSGVGCYINEEPKNALVEVVFGSAWYGVNR